MPEYALIVLFLLFVTVILHRRYRVKLFKSKSHLFIFYAIILLVGIAWDHIAISRGHWSFGERFLLGPRIGLMPIEEYAFGLIVPYFGLVVYKILERYLNS